MLLGIAAAGTSQVTGSLLVFALLVAPAAAAARITARPAAGVFLSVGLALLITWAGEIIAFYSAFPIGFWVTSLGFAVFLAASLSDRARESARRRRRLSGSAGTRQPARSVA